MIPYLPDGIMLILERHQTSDFNYKRSLHEFKIGLIVGSIYIFLNIRRYTVSRMPKVKYFDSKGSTTPRRYSDVGY